MNYLTYGDKRKKSIVLIHGMAATATLCYERLLPFLDYYYVILVQVDGHIEGEFTSLESLEDACTDVERYINEELGGSVFCLSGYGMGGTMAVEIAGRNNVKIDKLFLDAAFLTQMDARTMKIYKNFFWLALKWLKLGLPVPEVLMDATMGEDNRAGVDFLFKGINRETVYNACDYIYTYSIPQGIRNFSGDVMFIFGDKEPYPRRSAKLLQSYLPSIQIKELLETGHGEYLWRNPEKYSNILLDFLEGYAGDNNSSTEEAPLASIQSNNERLVKMQCEQCGAPLEIDIDNFMAFCPHCGAKLLIDMANIQKVMIEKEQSKRQEKRFEHELEMQKIEDKNNKDFWKKAIIGIAIFFGAFILLILLDIFM